MDTIRTNLKNNASSQYTNFPFTSLCLFNGVILGAGPTGLFKPCCVSPTDNGVNIDAHFMPIISDFGMPEVKTPRHVYIGGECTGSLAVTATADTGTSSGPHTLTFIGASNLQARRATLGRGLSGSYIKIKIANIAGSSFKVNSVLVHIDRKSKINI